MYAVSILSDGEVSLILSCLGNYLFIRKVLDLVSMIRPHICLLGVAKYMIRFTCPAYLYNSSC